MDESIREFLNEHRTTARWLDDIIDALMRFAGTAHVRSIAGELSKSYLRDIDTIEETVTRRINDFCSDAADFKKDKQHDLFERVEPATYRLRTYLERPRVMELMRIEFEEIALQSMWNTLAEIVRKRNQKNWSAAGNEKKLAAFVNWIVREKVNAEYQRRKQ